MVFTVQDTVLTKLEHGRHVLCEKPIGLTADQAEEMADFAKEMVHPSLLSLSVCVSFISLSGGPGRGYGQPFYFIFLV